MRFDDIAASFPRAGAGSRTLNSRLLDGRFKIEVLEERAEVGEGEEKKNAKRGSVRESRVPGRRDEGVETRNDAPLMV